MNKNSSSLKKILTEKSDCMAQIRPGVKVKEEIGRSGFPFQKEVERLFLENKCPFYYPHQTEIPLSVPSEYASTKFVPPSLDMVLCYAEHPSRYPPKWSIDLLLECKKAYSKDWYFFTKLSGSYYRSDRFPLSAAVRGQNASERSRITSLFFGCDLLSSTDKAVVCDNLIEFKSKDNKTKLDDRTVAYEACGTLSVALIHYLNKAIKSMNHLEENGRDPDDVTLVFPILVTTANLHIIDSKKLSTNLSTGKCDPSSIETEKVDWVLFDFPLAPSLQVKAADEAHLNDSEKELANKMVCLIVQAHSLIDCLNRFNPHLFQRIAKTFLEENGDS